MKQSQMTAVDVNLSLPARVTLQLHLFHLDEMGGNWQLKLNGHDRFKRKTY